LEIISSGIDNNLITLNSNGEIVENFPVQLPAMVSNEIAAADLNNDSAYEIILTTLDGNVNAITANGENLDGFPVELGAVAITDPIILPNKKIVVANANNQLMLISAAGNIEMQLSLASRVQKSPIAADFDGDGELEIAFSTQNKEIAIITQNGEYMEGWPITISSLPYNPPLAADIDNDSQIELLQFTILNNLYIFKPDGEQMDFTPVEINLSGNLPATIADIDEDGDPEVVSGISNGVYAIDIKTTYGSQHPWITYRGNYHRTGYFEDNDLVANEPQGLPEFKQKLFAAYPNPFNPSTNISFALSQPAHVNIIIYNIKGQKIRTLTSNEYEKGKYILNWNGEDNNLQSVSSGIYFYKMEVNGKTTEVRKCMLLK
ncbi:MAG: T9SS type A sorting domain-containing protein, partial [Candidatus Cloacimonadota bacterium]|nr:T9SS type A sorting domain-containing protein [Candidatus Cloacimonadota bacterium]